MRGIEETGGRGWGYSFSGKHPAKFADRARGRSLPVGARSGSPLGLCSTSLLSRTSLYIVRQSRVILCKGNQAAWGVSLMPRAFITPRKVESLGSPVGERAL